MQLRGWMANGATLGMSAIGWSEFLCVPYLRHLFSDKPEDTGRFIATGSLPRVAKTVAKRGLRVKRSFTCSFAVMILWVLIFCAGASAAGEAIRVQGGPWMLAGRAFASAKVSAHPHLIVVLHGDAPEANPSYQYVLAERAAGAIDDVVVVGLLRPGYKDARGDESQGRRGWALADNYTPQDIGSVASAAKALVDRYHAADLTLVGHSGGECRKFRVCEPYKGALLRAGGKYGNEPGRADKR
ncbi:MAG: hypothetical protein WAU33_18615 [Candidatus Binataceae bacterium]